MTIHEIKRHATEMQVPVHEALLARFRYIREQLIIEANDSWQYPDPVTEAVCEHLRLNRFQGLAKEQAALLAELKRLAGPRSKTPEQITEDMIDRARQYPVTSLIDFQRGKALAWCHEDRNPSLYLAPRINKACCPVCGKYFDPIAILRDRDGLTFPDAVRRLAA